MTKDELKLLMPPGRFKRVTEEEINSCNSMIADSPFLDKEVISNYVEEYRYLISEFSSLTKFVKAVKFVVYHIVMDKPYLDSFKLSHSDLIFDVDGEPLSDRQIGVLARAFKNSRIVKYLIDLVNVTTYELFKEKRFDVLNYLYETSLSSEEKTIHRIKASEVFLAQTAPPVITQPLVAINNKVTTTNNTNTTAVSDMFEDNMIKFRAFVVQSKEMLKHESTTVEQIGNFKVSAHDYD